MSEQRINVSGIGWVLPASVGAGTEILGRDDWLDPVGPEHDELENFNVRPYLQSVKGYLDPAGAYCLAAASLALGEHHSADEVRPDAGICTVTQYGAPTSGFKFFGQLVQKGPRLASPLLFPHSYSNTAGNLAAIEFGFGGPHVVFYAGGEVQDAFDFALNRLEDGTAAEMIVAAYEAVPPQTVPDGTTVLEGAVCVWLSVRESAPELLAVKREALTTPLQSADKDLGSVYRLLTLLQRVGAER